MTRSIFSFYLPCFLSFLFFPSVLSTCDFTFTGVTHGGGTDCTESSGSLTGCIYSSTIYLVIEGADFDPDASTITLLGDSGASDPCVSAPEYSPFDNAFVCELKDYTQRDSYTALELTIDGCSVSSAFSISYIGRPVLTSITVETSVTGGVLSYAGGYCEVDGSGGLKNCPRRPASPYYADASVTLTFNGANFVTGQTISLDTTSSPCAETSLTRVSDSVATCTLRVLDVSDPQTTVVNIFTTKGGYSAASKTVARATRPTITGIDAPDCTANSHTSTNDVLTSCPTSGTHTLTVYGTDFKNLNLNLPLPSIAASAVSVLVGQYCSTQPTPLGGSENTAFTCTLKLNSGGTKVYPQVFMDGGFSLAQSTYSITWGATITSVTVIKTSTITVDDGTTGTVVCRVGDGLNGAPAGSVFDCPAGALVGVGGATVYITGTGFSSGSTYGVVSSSICSTTPTYLSATLIKCTMKALSGGNPTAAAVQVLIDSVATSSTGAPTFAYIDVPGIGGFTHDNGAGVSCSGGMSSSATGCPSVGGGVLTIHGSKFGYTSPSVTGATISLSNTVCTGTPTWVSDSQLICILKGRGSSASTVTPGITVGTQTSTSNTISLTWPDPTIDSISGGGCTASDDNLIHCPTDGGAEVTFTGTNFGSDDATITLPSSTICAGAATQVAPFKNTLIKCILKANPVKGTATTVFPQLTINGVTTAIGPSATYMATPSISTLRHDNCKGNNVLGAAFAKLTDCPQGGTGYLTITGNHFGNDPSVISMIDNSFCDTDTPYTFTIEAAQTAIKCRLKARVSSLYATLAPSLTVGSLTLASSSNYQITYAADAVPTLTSITLSSYDALDVQGCKDDGAGGLEKCPTDSSAIMITFTGTNFVSPVTSNACASSTCSLVNDGTGTKCTCTLKSAAAGTSLSASIVASGGTSNTKFIGWVSNTFEVSPAATLSITGVQSIQFTVDPSSAGSIYVVAIQASGATSPSIFTPSFMKSTSATASAGANQIICRSSTSGVSIISGSQTHTATCTPASGTGMGDTIDHNSVIIAVYIESSGRPGSLYVSSAKTVCASSCETCNDVTHGGCKTCTSGKHISGSAAPTSAVQGFCCDNSCATCGNYLSPGDYSAASQCTGCTALTVTAPNRPTVNPNVFIGSSWSTSTAFVKPGYSGSYSASAKGFCCHYSCLTCVDSTAGKCTSCPGRNADVALASTSTASFTDSAGQFQSSPPTYGTCSDLSGGAGNAYAEIRGDPHFHGFQDQSYTITGAPDTVYNIISCPNIQMNTRFISYGDIYDGEDPTFNPPKPYSCNVTYIGEIGIKFRDVKTNKEYKFYTNIANMEVKVNDELVPMGKEHQIYSEASVSHAKDSIEIITPFFKWKFLRTGPKNKRFFNEQVAVRDWDSLPSCHGLLGQTHQREQMAIDRNAFDFEHVPGQDFLFKNAEFLDGRLIEYEIAENDVFGHKNAFDRYTPQ